MTLKSLIFIFLPPIFKKRNFFDLDGYKKEEIIEQKIWIEKKEEIDDDEITKKIEDNLFEGKQRKKSAKLILVNYPYNQKQLEEIKNIATRIKLNKHLIVINVEKFEIIEGILKNQLLCPECESLHVRSKKQENKDVFYCLENDKTLEEEKVEAINQEIIISYLKNSCVIIDKMIKDMEIEKKIEISISEVGEVINNDNLKKKIISVLESL